MVEWRRFCRFCRVSPSIFHPITPATLNREGVTLVVQPIKQSTHILIIVYRVSESIIINLSRELKLQQRSNSIMVLGAILAYSAASYYAKKKGIPVEEVFSWSACPCSSYSSTATATTTESDDDEEDWVDPTYGYCYGNRPNHNKTSMNSNDAIINFNHELLLKSNCSDLSIRRNRSNQSHNQQGRTSSQSAPLPQPTITTSSRQLPDGETFLVPR